jgi:hypothetical protein
VIHDSEIKNIHKIQLEDLNGDILNRQKLTIDAAGLSNSYRNKRDGFTFFGPIKEIVRIIKIYNIIEWRSDK